MEEKNKDEKNIEENKMDDSNVEDSITEEYDVVTITVSDGTDREFAIMDTFEVEEKKYMAVSLIEGEEIQDGVFLYRYTEAEDGDLIVEVIKEPAEYKKVVKAYEKM